MRTYSKLGALAALAAMLALGGGVGVAEAAAARSVRAGLDTWRPLLAEAARAELDVGGALIDFGTADQHKYTRGGWESGWGANREDEGVSFAAVSGKAATLRLMLQRPADELVLRARSPKGAQRVAVSAGGKRLGAARVGKAWSVVRIPAVGLRPGRVELALGFARAGAEVDWLWLRAPGEAAEAPGLAPRVGPLRLGGSTRRALLAPTARTYSFYLHVPKGAALVFDVGSDQPVSFAVRAQTDAGELVELAEVPAKPGSFRAHRVGLGQLAGRAVRLDLVTRGPLGRTGWGEPEIMVPAAVARRARRKLVPAQNLVMVVLDTTRADAFASVAPSPEVEVATPHFDRLAARAAQFPNAYNNENWTKPSTATILSGLYPASHGARTAKDKLSAKVELLSERLQRRGVTTAGIVANANITDVFGFEQGWDYFDNQSRNGRGNAKDIYGDAIDWLDAHHDKGRFFLYLQSVDAHTTYRVPNEWVEPYYSGRYRGRIGKTFTAEEQRAISNGSMKASDADRAWIRALYRAEITYQDAWLGRLIDKLEALGRLDDTIVVITNDHGEELGEHGRWGHGWTLYEEQVRAPLLVHYPRSLPAGEAVAEVVEHVDLAPTLLELMGLPAFADADGMSLAALLTGRTPRQRPYYALHASRGMKRSIRVGRWKLVVGAESGWLQLYDLEGDPAELVDHRASRPVAGRLCEVYLGEGLATADKPRRLRDMTPQRKFEPGAAAIDPATRRQLEALGYLGAEEPPPDDEDADDAE